METNSTNRALLDETQLGDIGTKLDEVVNRQVDWLALIQQQYPQLRFTVCSEDDTGCHEPFHSYDQFDLHLVAHSLSGCSSLTQDVNHCTGLVIALHEE